MLLQAMNTQAGIVHELRGGISGCSPERCGKFLHQITDLLVADSDQYSDEQIALFDEVISELATTIEKEARILLAQRLAPVRNAPPNIIRMLAADDAIEVAAPVLTESEQLDDPALIENARTKSQQHLLAISRRKRLSEAVTDILVERGDQPVLLSTASNFGAKFSTEGFALLVERSGGEDALAACVGSRTDIPPHLFLKLLATASDAVRAKLEAESPRAGQEIHQVVEEVTNRIRAAVRCRATDYASAQALVRSLHAAGQLDASKLAAFALSRKFEETVAAFAIMSDLPIKVVERAIREDRPETLLIFAKAIGLSWPVTKAILRLRTGENGVPTDNVEHGLAIFERLKRPTAQQILRFHRLRQSQS
jgi:uncharacterized protein (DUF2336 family)